MNKTQSAAPAAFSHGCVLSLRTRTGNPNHHLWFNNGCWWMHCTIHLRDYTKQRIRRSLRTANIETARLRRDAALGLPV